MATILDKIVEQKRLEVAAANEARPERELQAAVADAPPVRSFFEPLAAPGPIKLIAEVKKASPSQGVIRADFDPVAIAEQYTAAGATCLSVLTDQPFFQGRLEFLTAIRRAVSLPLLRKDFIIDPYQVWEARVAGADAVLLIAECLDDCRLRQLHQLILDLGMVPLVEFYEPANLPRVLAAGATLIGINNRDLRTFQVDLQHTVRLRPQIPDECVLVGESGIHSHEDARRLQDAGVDAMLVGEHLMRQPDLQAAVRQLLGT
jgi:indole-3-glycerol phosphate synthase